ncbi:hypothetical protein [Longimicrobium sp.]|jgi:hypothetical protein|uniref:hypothetical protein n=1 Tax=Longimicrobium sp. TaxID=2029185 RepID=UPI0039C9620F
MDALSRIARASSEHIHTDEWFEELRAHWGGPPSSIDSPGPTGVTPLMHAVDHGSPKIVEAFLLVWKAHPNEPSAHPNAPKYIGNVPGTPYDHAVLENRPDLLIRW